MTGNMDRVRSVRTEYKIPYKAITNSYPNRPLVLLEESIYTNRSGWQAHWERNNILKEDSYMELNKNVSVRKNKLIGVFLIY